MTLVTLRVVWYIIIIIAGWFRGSCTHSRL